MRFEPALLLVLAVVAIFAVSVSAARGPEQMWRVFCTPGTGDCPEYPLDAVIDHDLTPYLAGAGDSAGSGVFKLVAPGQWEQQLDGAITGINVQPYSYNIVASGYAVEGPALFSRVGNTTEFVPVAASKGMAFNRPDCTSMNFYTNDVCTVTGSTVGAAGASVNVAALSTLGSSTRAWVLTPLPGGELATFRHASEFFGGFRLGSHATWGYTDAEARADADSGCLRTSRSRCYAVGPQLAADADALYAANARWVGAGFKSQVSKSTDGSKWESVLEETPDKAGTKVPEGFALNAASCGRIQASLMLCLSAGENADGSRGVWVGSANSRDWSVLTGDEKTGNAAAVREMLGSIAARSILKSGEVKSEYIYAFTNLRYAGTRRAFLALAEIKGTDGERKQAIVISPNAVIWRTVTLPPMAYACEKLVSLDITVLGGEEYITVMGRDIKGGNVFAAWNTIREIQINE